MICLHFNAKYTSKYTTQANYSHFRYQQLFCMEKCSAWKLFILVFDIELILLKTKIQLRKFKEPNWLYSVVHE